MGIRKLLLLLLAVSPSLSIVPCILTWKRFDRGNPSPVNAVNFLDSSFHLVNETFYISRHRYLNSWVVSGLYPNDTSIFPSPNETEELWSLEFLMNEDGCETGFIAMRNESVEDAEVKMEERDGEVVGIGRTRCTKEFTFWCPCLITERLCIAFDLRTGNTSNHKVFQKLISFQPELQLTFLSPNVTLLKKETKLEVLSDEYLYNKADVDLIRTFRKTTSVRQTQTFDLDFSIGLRLGLSLVIGRGWQSPMAPDFQGYGTLSFSHSETHSTYNDVSITIENEVEVPGRKSVRIQSTVIMQTLTLQITGNATVTNNGVDPKLITAFLEREGHQNYHVSKEGIVSIPISMTATISTPTHTDLLLTPANTYGNATFPMRIEEADKTEIEEAVKDFTAALETKNII